MALVVAAPVIVLFLALGDEKVSAEKSFAAGAERLKCTFIHV
jgi:hypothetical protein